MVSWNVNGLRSCANKGFCESFASLDADVLCLQETKMQPGQLELNLDGYRQFWYSADKKGYSGTAVFTRLPVYDVAYGLGIDEHDHEGRVITVEFSDFYLVNCYSPNAQPELRRIEYRLRFEDALRAHLRRLDDVKPAILCGDLNVAHEEIDLRHPKPNRGRAGFSDEERAEFTKLLSAGFVDSFRHFYPDIAGAYSWWSYFGNARANNTGWRIDYFVVSERAKSRMRDARIHPEIMGSDHCPVELIL